MASAVRSPWASALRSCGAPARRILGGAMKECAIRPLLAAAAAANPRLERYESSRISSPVFIVGATVYKDRHRRTLRGASGRAQHALFLLSVRQLLGHQAGARCDGDRIRRCPPAGTVHRYVAGEPGVCAAVLGPGLEN